MLPGGIERALEVVEHRQQLLDQPLVCARGEALLLARRPLAVVVEVGCEPLQVAQVLVPLRLRSGESSSRRASCRLLVSCSAPRQAGTPTRSGVTWLGRLFGHDFCAVVLVDDLVLGVLDDLVLGRPVGAPAPSAAVPAACACA